MVACCPIYTKLSCSSGGRGCVRVGTDQYVAAVGMDGQFFEYDSRNCVSEHGGAICSADRITIRTKPITCKEVLVVGNFVTLPRVCADELKVGVCTKQEYIRNRGQVYIFTPYDDTVVYDCSGTQETRTLQSGTTLFKSSLCTIRTSELYIQSIGDSVSVTVEVSSELSKELSEMDTVMDDIALGQAVNLANQTTLLSSYLEVNGIEAADLSRAEEELQRFKKVEMLSNYTLFDFNLDIPLGMSNAVTGAYVGLGFLLLISSVLCCCTCKCFRIAVFGLLKLCGTAIYRLFCCLICMVRRAASDREASDATQMDDLSVVASTTERRVARRRTRRKTGSGALESMGESLSYRERPKLTFEATTLSVISEPPGSLDRGRDLEAEMTSDESTSTSSEPLSEAVGSGQPIHSTPSRGPGFNGGISFPAGFRNPVANPENLTNANSAMTVILGKHTIEGRDMWNEDYTSVLKRPAVIEDLASPWRIDACVSHKLRVVRGTSFEELEYLPDEDKVVNASGLAVSTDRPEYFVRMEYFRLLDRITDKQKRWDAGSNCSEPEDMNGIFVPKWLKHAHWDIIWLYEAAEDTW